MYARRNEGDAGPCSLPPTPSLWTIRRTGTLLTEINHSLETPRACRATAVENLEVGPSTQATAGVLFGWDVLKTTRTRR